MLGCPPAFYYSTWGAVTLAKTINKTTLWSAWFVIVSYQQYKGFQLSYCVHCYGLLVQALQVIDVDNTWYASCSL